MEFFIYVIPFFLLLIGLEYGYGRRSGKQYYRFSDTLTNLSLGLGTQIVDKFSMLLLMGVYYWFYQQWGLFTDYLQPSWGAALLSIVVYDLCYYWIHRLGHECNLF